MRAFIVSTLKTLAVIQLLINQLYILLCVVHDAAQSAFHSSLNVASNSLEAPSVFQR